MFDSLSGRLSSAVKNLTGKGRLSESNIKDTLRQVRLALLEADVALPVVKTFVEKIRERAVGEEVGKSLTPGQALVKIIHTELVALLGSDSVGERPALLVANLPYHIASPILIDLLLCDVPLGRFCFSVQREVADRITARPSTKDYGPISILLQLCGTVHKITHLPPQAFWPAPKVESTALRIDIDLSRFPDKTLLRQFSDLLRLAFSHRRKTLNYNLKQQYEPAHFGPACAAAGIDPGMRAEALSPEQWYELFCRISRAC